MSKSRSLWFYLKMIFLTRRAIRAYEKLIKSDDVELKSMVTTIEFLTAAEALDVATVESYERALQGYLISVAFPADVRLGRRRRRLLKDIGYPVLIERTYANGQVEAMVSIEVNGLKVSTSSQLTLAA